MKVEAQYEELGNGTRTTCVPLGTIEALGSKSSAPTKTASA
jgi:hypothetical protein